MKNLMKTLFVFAIAIAAGCNDSGVTPRSAKADGTAAVEAPLPTDPKLLELLGKIERKLDNIQPTAPVDVDAIAKAVRDQVKGPDADSDGVIDKDDECKDKAEDVDQFKDEDGCPDTDNDRDNILDADDACPDQPGFLSDDEELIGCLDAHPDEDADSDGIKNVDDACDDEAGVPNEDDEKNGCPAPDVTTVTETQTEVGGTTTTATTTETTVEEGDTVEKKCDCDEDKAKTVKVKVPPPPPTPESVLKELRWYAHKTDKRIDKLETDAATWRADHEKLDSVAKELAARRPGAAPAPQADKPAPAPATATNGGTFDLGVR